jgi:hypothetical protein
LLQLWVGWLVVLLLLMLCKPQGCSQRQPF